MMILIGLSIGIPLATKNKQEIDVTTTTLEPASTTDQPLDSTPSRDESTTDETTSMPTTTSPFPEDVRFIEKSIWQEKGLSLEGKYKQLQPIDKIIVGTIAITCFDAVSSRFLSII